MPPGDAVGMPPGDAVGMPPGGIAPRGDAPGLTARPGPAVTPVSRARRVHVTTVRGERVRRQRVAAWASAVAGRAGGGTDGPSVDHLFARCHGPIYGHSRGLMGDPA